MQGYVVRRHEIDAMGGVFKQHAQNTNAQRTNKSLSDATGLTGIGVHIIEVEPGRESTEYHVHYHEDECVYILSGSASVTIGEESFTVEPGDFIGYRAGGEAHTMLNTGAETLRCMVIGERLAHDVADYPRKRKRIFRNTGVEWNTVSFDHLENNHK